MTTTTLLQRIPLFVPACAVALLALLGCATPSYAQSVVVMVNGEPITNYDIEQRTKLDFLSTHKAPTRQEVIDELIDQKVKVREAKQFSVDPTSSDIDAAFAQMGSRMHITADQLAKSLETQGIRPETLKERIKAEMVWTSLVRGRYKESLQVGEKEVAAAARAQGDDGKDDEAEYRKLRISDAADRSDRPAWISADRRRGKGQGGRGVARPFADLRGGQHVLQVDAERRDSRQRDENLGRFAAYDS